MNDPDKTQEWTPEIVSQHFLDGGWKRVADAHNAAIRAQQELLEGELRNGTALFRELVIAEKQLEAQQQDTENLRFALKQIADADPKHIGQSQYKIIATQALLLSQARGKDLQTEKKGGE